MKIELIAYTQPYAAFDNPTWGDPLNIVEQCVCVCYDSKPTKECRIAKSCMDSGHNSVFEHINFTFHIKDVSRALLAELSRHRHISLSVRSTRYCDERDFRWRTIYTNDIVLDDILNNVISNAQDAYAYGLEHGDVSKDELRGVLPLAMYTELYMTANARALIEISHLRLCNRAHNEIRTMFEKIKEQVRLVSPEIADYMRPKCETNKEYPFCTEKQCCGKHKKLEEIYSK